MLSPKKYRVLKTYTYSGLMFVIILFLAVTGCEQQFDEFEPDPITGNVEYFFSAVPDNIEQFDFNASEKSYLVSESNTLIVIPDQSVFLLANGEAVKSGQISVELKESQSVSDFILQRYSNIGANGELLQSLLYLDISFFHEGQELVLDESSQNLLVRFPKNGRPYADLNVYRDNDRGSWTLSDQAEVSLVQFNKDDIPEGIDISWEGQGYELGWIPSETISISRVLSVSNATTVTLCLNSIQNKYSNTNSFAFASFKGENSVVIMDYDEATGSFCLPTGIETKDNNIDVGLISSQNPKEYLFDLKSININSSRALTEFDPVQMSLEKILESLKDL